MEESALLKVAKGKYRLENFFTEKIYEFERQSNG